MSERLVDPYDVALFDLDGVVYIGPYAVDGAPEALAGLHAAGVRTMYLTNNAAPSPQSVADKLVNLGIPAPLDDVITSAQVAVDGLKRALPPGARVLVVGSGNLARLCAEAGFEVTGSADDQPAAVLQGYDPQLTWPRLDEAAFAVQRGAAWYATNDDATRPTERGLVPGLGVALYGVGLTVRVQPTIFGKPYPPMFDYAQRRTGARRPIFVGDRLDTDIAGAVAAGMDSLLVFSGAHGKHELLAASPDERPTAIGADLAALLLPPRRARLGGEVAFCGAHTVRKVAVDLRPDGALPTTVDGQLDILWAAAQLTWAGVGGEVDHLLESLDLIR